MPFAPVTVIICVHALTVSPFSTASRMSFGPLVFSKEAGANVDGIENRTSWPKIGEITV